MHPKLSSYPGLSPGERGVRARGGQVGKMQVLRETRACHANMYSTVKHPIVDPLRRWHNRNNLLSTVAAVKFQPPNVHFPVVLFWT